MKDSVSLWRFDVLPIRLIAAAVPIGFILSGFLFSSPGVHWTFLLLVSVAFGYVHFIIATTYQYEGILRSPERTKLLKWFYILSGIGLLVSIFIIAAGYTLLLSLLSISYFVLHVLSNEHTFLTRNKTINLPYWTVLTLIIPAGALYLVSLTHGSLFFNYDLQYYGLKLVERIQIIGKIIPVAWLEPLAIVSLLLFIFLIPLVLYLKFQKKLAALIYLFIGLSTLAVVTSSIEVSFMYVLHFVLVYHFVLLSLLFIKPMKEKGGRIWKTYCYRHLYLLVPITIAAILFMFELETRSILDYLFQFQIFVTLSITHITASILNEHWFKAWLFRSK